MALTRELGGVLRFDDGGVAQTRAAHLHPETWSSLDGNEWPTLQLVTARLLSLPCSSAGSERACTPLSRVLSRRKNRTMNGRVDQQWAVVVNSQQQKRVSQLVHTPSRPPSAPLCTWSYVASQRR